MDFEQPEERLMLADALERYLNEQYPMKARQAAAYGATGRSSDCFSGLVELGVVSALFPESMGGLGGDPFDVETVFEKLGRHLVTEPLLDTIIAGRIAMAAGCTAADLEPWVTGKQCVALAHDEPQNHYESTRVTTRARCQHDQWLLEGVKGPVRNAETVDAFLVSARTACVESGSADVTLFLVPRTTTGITIRGHGRIDGGRCGDVAFHDVTVGDSARVGAVGQGVQLLPTGIRWGILGICAEALGVMDVARAMTIEYLHTRKQFGVPIGSFQALQHRMGDVLMEIEEARSAVTNIAAALQDAEPLASARAASAAKYTIGHVGRHVAEECIQLHGGIGMTWELSLSHYAKRLVMIDHELGDEDYHLQRFSELSRQTS